MFNSHHSPPLLTVTQLTQAIKLNLESMFPLIYLQGEITNFKVQSSGHLYFTLKDSNAHISAVLFKGEAAFVKPVPKAGDHVMVKGEISVYPPKGNYQLIVRELSYMGLGELLQKLEQLKIKLHQKGWFKSISKKPLPLFPKRIGVVTSPTGAVIQDILHILTRRFSGFHLILNPVKVQGEGAAQEIAQAIEQFNRYQLVDVIIVGRGGGSLEDLWAFNEECVASAIYHSAIPIISAVGHETDHCIADYVADVRAPTPSAAAEIVIAEKKHQLDRLNTLKKGIRQTVCHLVQQNRNRLEGLGRHPIFTHPHLLLEWRMQELDDYQESLLEKIKHYFRLKHQRLESGLSQLAALKPTNQLSHMRKRLNDLERSFYVSLQNQILRTKEHLQQISYRMHTTWVRQQLKRRHLVEKKCDFQRLHQMIQDQIYASKQKYVHMKQLLEAIDPKNLLQQGYTILFAQKESFIINSISQLTKGQQAKLLLSDGEALITINEVYSREQ
ncbi:MAG: exodeoxyribonuclease VII large subunit [Candidatus Protochlamydia sp.]|nr:exodeoxyribonuclease VII large subunit [Candidatus Protochlamydia sp.]